MTLRPMIATNSTPTSPFETFDQLFGSSFNDCLRTRIMPPTLDFHEPWGKISSEYSGTSSVTMDEDGFKIVMDVQHFKPEEITVEQVDDSVVVEGKHEETKDEHGFVSRHFVRRYALPQGVDRQSLKSTLSSDGVLTITAPKL
ncbi:alpha-crystallin A chain-like [Ischnura elegans]|uniref:alpha-crystallin A chain-like n=1 Tax=Ischnura elegans TaxID=197161 RepID=UPI001ED896AE|nr:alpha-crystallin A chain-like [Ischnura elegans]